MYYALSYRWHFQIEVQLKSYSRVFSFMQSYWNKWECLNKNKVLAQNWCGTLNMAAIFRCITNLAAPMSCENAL